jgi:microcompartment protein CcmK/EutM
VVLDTLGAPRGATVLVSTDGEIQRKLRGNTCPARLTVVALVDFVGGVQV